MNHEVMDRVDVHGEAGNFMHDVIENVFTIYRRNRQAPVKATSLLISAAINIGVAAFMLVGLFALSYTFRYGI